jgi:hypothetical protein
MAPRWIDVSFFRQLLKITSVVRYSTWVWVEYSIVSVELTDALRQMSCCEGECAVWMEWNVQNRATALFVCVLMIFLGCMAAYGPSLILVVSHVTDVGGC